MVFEIYDAWPAALHSTIIDRKPMTINEDIPIIIQQNVLLTG